MDTPSLSVLDDAIEKIYQIKSGADTAICLCSDVAHDPAAAGSALQSLRRVQQDLHDLRQAAPQLQQLAAACARQQQQQQQAGQAAGTLANGHEQQQQQLDATLSALQQQARAAAAALQQQVQASLCLPRGVVLSCQRPRHASAADLLLLLQRLSAAAPQLHIHLLRASCQHLVASLTRKSGRRIPDAAALSRMVSYIDEVRVEVPGVFCASIGLTAAGQLEPLRLVVDAADRTAAVDPWSPSRHQVFKRISALAVRALHHFQLLQAAQRALEPHHHHHPNSAAAAAGDQAAAGIAAAAGSSSSSRPSTGLALECLMLWLACYDDLFTRPCDVSGKLIAWEPATAIPLPPVLRPYWLSLEELTAAASDASKRRAYHAQLAPWPL